MLNWTLPVWNREDLDLFDYDDPFYADWLRTNEADKLLERTLPQGFCVDEEEFKLRAGFEWVVDWRRHLFDARHEIFALAEYRMKHFIYDPGWDEAAVQTVSDAVCPCQIRLMFGAGI